MKPAANSGFSIEFLKISDADYIREIAGWYNSEWKIPEERSISRLSAQAEDDILFQLVVKKEGRIISTGGIYFKIGLQFEHERFLRVGPWVGLVVTIPEERKKGIGKFLLDAIEAESKARGYSKLYLYTSTAESLYAASGWVTTERVMYRGLENAVMEKVIA